MFKGGLEAIFCIGTGSCSCQNSGPEIPFTWHSKQFVEIGASGQDVFGNPLEYNEAAFRAQGEKIGESIKKDRCP